MLWFATVPQRNVLGVRMSASVIIIKTRLFMKTMSVCNVVLNVLNYCLRDKELTISMAVVF